MFLIRCMMLFQRRTADRVECISACICPCHYLRASATYECIHLCVYMTMCIYGTLAVALCISYVTFRRSKWSTFRRSKRSTFRRSKRTPDPGQPVNQATGRSASQPACQPVNRPVSRSTGQPAAVNRPVDRARLTGPVSPIARHRSEPARDRPSGLMTIPQDVYILQFHPTVGQKSWNQQIPLIPFIPLIPRLMLSPAPSFHHASIILAWSPAASKTRVMASTCNESAETIQKMGSSTFSRVLHHRYPRFEAENAGKVSPTGWVFLHFMAIPCRLWEGKIPRGQSAPMISGLDSAWIFGNVNLPIGLWNSAGKLVNFPLPCVRVCVDQKLSVWIWFPAASDHQYCHSRSRLLFCHL